MKLAGCPSVAGPVNVMLRLGDEGSDDRVGQLDVAFIADVAQGGGGQTGHPDLEELDTFRRVYGVLDRALGVQVGWLRRREVHPTLADVALFVCDAVIAAEDHVGLGAAGGAEALCVEELDDPRVGAAVLVVDGLDLVVVGVDGGLRKR